VGIIAGVGGGVAIVVLILVVVLAVVCHRLKQAQDMLSSGKVLSAKLVVWRLHEEVCQTS
jgi:hypothetical protein